jgi:hypothetical protein
LISWASTLFQLSCSWSYPSSKSFAWGWSFEFLSRWTSSSIEHRPAILRQSNGVSICSTRAWVCLRKDLRLVFFIFFNFGFSWFLVPGLDHFDTLLELFNNCLSFILFLFFNFLSFVYLLIVSLFESII